MSSVVSFEGLATAAWINVASPDAGATCEESSFAWYGNWPFNCKRAIDRYLIPNYAWIPRGSGNDPWIKVRWLT